jgi:uroporphyrinogen-III synthase
MVARVVLTRPAPRQVALKDALEAAGIEVLALPALEIVAFDNASPLPKPCEFDVAVFVSRTAWQIFWQALRAQDPSFKWPVSCQLASVGATTAKAIEHDLQQTPERGEFSVLTPAADTTQDSESLWLKLGQALRPGAKVLLVRGEAGRDWLAQTLAAHGFVTHIYENYRREPAQWSASAIATLRQWQAFGTLGTWLFTSAQGLSAIQAQWVAHDMGNARPESAVVIHPRLQALVGLWLPLMSTVRLAQPDDLSVFNALTKQR